MEKQVNPNKILSDVIVFSKYARYLSEIQRRETWDEIVMRNMDMHLGRYPYLRGEIIDVYKNFVLPKKVLPSMRSLQFGGKPIEVAPNRMYNCCYMPVDDTDAFSEMMFLLLGGTGGGYSVQRQHVGKLPPVQGPSGDTRRYLAGDSIEGWADTIKVVIESYFLGKSKVRVDYRDIRKKGAQLITSGGKAPGPEPLKKCVKDISKLLDKAVGRKIKPIEAHDIMCHIANAVLAGGIRRAALICLFSRDDEEMLLCKSGEWWEDNEQRGRANNSVVLPRSKVSSSDFQYIWKKIKESKSGEPGVYWTSNEDYGTNPCCEVALRPYTFCNLTECNVSNVEDQYDFNQRVRAAAFLSTLQAGYTDFHYLRPIWKENTEQDALIGVGLTGIGSGAVLDLDLAWGADIVKKENDRVSGIIGINPASRTTTVKPSGTSSLVCGCSSGIHAWFNNYYVRRIRIDKNEALYGYLHSKFPKLIEDEKLNPKVAVASFPQKSPKGAIIRTESAMDTLERVRKFNQEWVREGHVEGDNTNNVSCTVSIKEPEWKHVGEWMWNNRFDYNGIAVLPYDGGTYPQLPFEDITKESFDSMVELLQDINITDIQEESNMTNLQGEVACSGGACLF